MHIVPSTLTIKACEDLLKKITELDPNYKLLLPVSTKKYSFGGIAIATQTIITWARRNNNRHLEIKESNSEKIDILEETIKYPHKFIATMMAKSIYKSDIQIQKDIYLIAKTSIENQATKSYGQNHGRFCWFAFIDHSTKGFDRNFYIRRDDKKAIVRKREQIKTIIISMSGKSSLIAGGGNLPKKSNLNEIGEIFYELFLNTHEHGSRDKSRSDWIKPGARLVYTNGINLTEKSARNLTSEEKALTTYISKQKINLDSINRFVEISIVDSGLGFCGRWLADHQNEKSTQSISIDEEYKIFQKCFSFRQTSTGKDNKGYGLARVLESLTKVQGFMRIRSGRLSLFRDFITTPYSHNDNCDFSDWTTCKTGKNNLTQMTEVSGVSITLLVPLEPKL